MKTLEQKLRQVGWADSATGCWEWKGRRNALGYGGVGKNMLAHRAAYEVWLGPIPVGASICHTCDNPPCINPAHLYAGTHLENMQDKHSRGRDNYISGDEHPSSKATQEIAREIYSLCGTASARVIGERYGLARSTVANIWGGRSRKYLSEGGDATHG